MLARCVTSYVRPPIYQLQRVTLITAKINQSYGPASLEAAAVRFSATRIEIPSSLSKRKYS